MDEGAVVKKKKRWQIAGKVIVSGEGLVEGLMLAANANTAQYPIKEVCVSLLVHF